MFYGANIWDPLLIISQIVALQSLSYLGMGLLLWMIVSPYHQGPLSLHFLFDWRYINAHSFTGWLSILTSFLNAFMCAAYLLPIVSRAKKCLDFASTLYIWHAVFTISLSGWPKSMVWWAVLFTNMAITSLLGEWLCLQREMREIPLNQIRDRARNPAGSAARPSSAPQGPAKSGGATARAGSSSIAMTSRGGGSGGGREQAHGRSSSSARHTANAV